MLPKTWSLDALLTVNAERLPGHVAVLDVRHGSAVTHAELLCRVRQTECGLLAFGIRPTDRVALMLPNSIEYVVNYLALQSLGCDAVPINPEAPDGELVRVLEKSRSRRLIAGDSHPLSNTVGISRIPDRQSQDAQASGFPVKLPDRPREGGVLLFTSGTTGEPKGVRLSTGQLLANAWHIQAHHRLTPADRGYSPLPLFHINAQVVGMLASLISGGTLILDDRFHAQDFWDVVAAAGATWINAVPAILGILARQSGHYQRPRQVAWVRSASAPLPLTVARAFENRYGYPIVETYGLTEAASQVCANPMPPDRGRQGSVGKPIGVALQIVDDQGELVREGDHGHIRIAGPHVITAYEGTGAGTFGPSADVFRGGWFHTGDQGYRDDEGYVYITARTRELVNRGGQKVSPREVEDVLQRHPAVLQAAVIGLPHPTLGESVHAYVTAIAGPTPPPALLGQLDALCRKFLSPYKRPETIHVVDRLPMGPTGKIQRLGLKQRILLGSASGGGTLG